MQRGFSVVLLAFCLLPSPATEGQPADYPLSGKVLSISPKGIHCYQVATDSRIYLLMCEKTKLIQITPPKCKVDDRLIATGDTIQFRVDGDSAYMPASKGGKQELRILTTELKVVPPLPAAPAGENGAGGNSGERGVVIGAGWHIAGQKEVAWSTDPFSANQPVAPAQSVTMARSYAPAAAAAAGPVMAVPVTGGAPVVVMPVGAGGGGVVTGIPVTGGPPVVGMPIGGGDADGIRSGPVWAHVLRLVAGKDLYTLECALKPCEVDKKQIQLGDTLVIRREKKWAYVSSGTGSAGKEQKLSILSETEDGASNAK